ncbi:hypothetical protein M426DRAFT_316642 [Hypoxylon sp. CI-4A]|nr:hypothetical protein M426DRAFT_316642 [Hypoxylon sp. CI-4A]
MPKLTEVRGPEEDWSGLKDARARRKLQNRLNVRAHRRRKALLSERITPTSSTAGDNPSVCSSLQDSCLGYEKSETANEDNSLVIRSQGSPYLLDGQHTLRGDEISSEFPLSLDHLIPLVQFNFIRGVLTNMGIMGYQTAFPPECSRLWVQVPLFEAPSTIPESLQPTALQLSTPHEPWIDLIPDKQMRDNAIRATGTFSPKEVEEEMTGAYFGKSKPIEIAGMVAWTDPWRPDGWELTEGFIRNWPFLVKDCWDLLESTNRWRAMRDEEPLVVEL